eukprot:758329-Hanusia_phi.AAC.2
MGGFNAQGMSKQPGRAAGVHAAGSKVKAEPEGMTSPKSTIVVSMEILDFEQTREDEEEEEEEEFREASSPSFLFVLIGKRQGAAMAAKLFEC